jgi:acetyltransferase-like isoleucine patch superfamily enzyme
MNKAIWYLTNPVEEGGMGITWRTSGEAETFGGGSYTMIVEDDPEGIKITILSTYKGRTREIAILANEDFSDAFSDFALLSDQDIDMAEGSAVEGGTVAVTEGNEVTGAGATGDEMTTLTQASIDTSYYDNQIAVSEGGGGSVVIGDQTYGDLDLNEVNLYVQGNVIINGTIYGTADLTASGNITVGPNGIVGQKVKLISPHDVTINSGAKVRKNAVLYAGDNLTIGDDVITADPAIYMTPKNLKVGKRSILSGKLYGGSLNVGESAQIEGNVIGGSYGEQNIIESSATITKKTYEQEVPPGFKKKVRFKRWLKRR